LFAIIQNQIIPLIHYCPLNRQ